MMRGQVQNEAAFSGVGRVLAVAFALLVFLLLPGTAAAQYHSSITLENGAGETAFVKLVGPSGRTVSVPRNENRTESSIAPGRYYIVVRYGDDEKNGCEQEFVAGADLGRFSGDGEYRKLQYGS